MTKRETAEKVLADSDGIARTADFLSAGLNKTDICAFYDEGFLERIRHGYYRLADNDDILEERLLLALIPEGIVCMESALYYYGYSDRFPRAWALAVPRTVSRAKLKTEAFDFKVYYIPKENYEIGKTTADFNGVCLSVYDRDRTICDCFKYRTRLNKEYFEKALRAYGADGKKNLDNLADYAQKMGIFNRVKIFIDRLGEMTAEEL